MNTWPQNRINETSTHQRLFPFIAGVGADYWFRLKKYRLEFLPSIGYQLNRHTLEPDNAASSNLTWTVLELYQGINYYPFDFANDCMCPTFSKQGQFFKKGFYISFGPGLALSRLSNNIAQKVIHQAIGFARFGIGFDLGISDLLTLSPTVQYQIGQHINWSNYFNSSTAEDLNIYSGLHGSLRLGWRLDKRR